ncbi:MAG: hypothetical protein DHS20C21_06370 [Gemmatimonadota bacterium]|nr:MAG: hypothetical protein DHS20C21_06370 [Gemmatimonadota bacterium]
MTRLHLGRGLVPLLLLSLPVAASAADELYLSATNKFEYRRFDQESRREEALRNRLEVSAYQGIFGAWVRLEGLQISAPSFYDPYGVFEETDEPGRIDRTEVTKRLFTVNTDSFRAEVGDVSHTFGRGLMLSVFEDEALNFDTRLEGFRGRVDHERGSATVIAGSAEGNRFRGVFVEPDARGPVRAGAGFVEAWGGESNTDVFPREQHAGAFAEVAAGPANFYGEYVERRFPGLEGAGAFGTPGRGAFAAADITLGSATASVEVRDFFRFEHAYNDPPTTLRQHTWTSLNRVNGQVLADIPDDDVLGVLASAEYAYDFFTTFQGSWSRLDRGDNDDDFFEVYGEAKGNWREKVFVTAAASESELSFGTLFEERIGGFGEVVYEFNDRNSLSVGVEWSEIQESSRVTREFEFPHEFSERIWYASWGRSPWLNLTFTYEDTTEEDPAEDRDEWYTLFAEIAVAENHDLNVSFGSEKGGWKCTGGVCFFEPEFEGLKVKWVARF